MGCAQDCSKVPLTKRWGSICFLPGIFFSSSQWLFSGYLCPSIPAHSAFLQQLWGFSPRSSTGFMPRGPFFPGPFRYNVRYDSTRHCVAAREYVSYIIRIYAVRDKTCSNKCFNCHPAGMFCTKTGCKDTKTASDDSIFNTCLTLPSSRRSEFRPGRETSRVRRAGNQREGGGW